MKLAIGGSRSVTDPGFVRGVVEAWAHIDDVQQVIHGGSPTGVDHIVSCWCKDRNVPQLPIAPAYHRYRGLSAPKVRNHRMASEADALLLIWDGFDAKAAHLAAAFVAVGKPVDVVIEPRAARRAMELARVDVSMSEPRTTEAM